MKLLAVTPYPPGMRGIGEYGQHVLQGLEATGAFDEIAVLADQAPNAPQREGQGGLRIDRVWSRDRLHTAFALQHHIRHEAPDMVWYNLGLSMFGAGRAAAFCGLSAPMLTKALGFPTFVTLHEIFQAVELASVGLADSALDRLGGRLVTRMLLAADVVCVTLARYVTLLQRHHGARNVVHLPHGVFSSPVAAPLDPVRPRVLMLAAHAPHKGLPLLLDACARLERTHPDLELVVVGADHPRFPGYVAALRATPRPFTRVRWTGYVSEAVLAQWIAGASVVVLPYLATTGSSSVLYRAAGAGRPVVASDLPDLRAVALEAGFAVRFFPPGDSPALTVALDGLLRNQAERRAMAEHNLQAAAHFSLEATCAAYLRLFTGGPAPIAIRQPSALRQTVTKANP